MITNLMICGDNKSYETAPNFENEIMKLQIINYSATIRHEDRRYHAKEVNSSLHKATGIDIGNVLSEECIETQPGPVRTGAIRRPQYTSQAITDDEAGRHVMNEFMYCNNCLWKGRPKTKTSCPRCGRYGTLSKANGEEPSEAISKVSWQASTKTSDRPSALSHRHFLKKPKEQAPVHPLQTEAAGFGKCRTVWSPDVDATGFGRCCSTAGGRSRPMKLLTLRH